MVGHQEYGKYFALFNFCFLFQILLDMGIQNYNTKQLAQNRAEVDSIFAHTFSTKLVLIFGFLLAVSAIGFCIGYPLSYFPVLLGVASIMVLQSLYVYLRSHFSALGHYRTDIWFSALDKWFMIILIGYAIYVQQKMNISIFIGGQITALIVVCILAFIRLSKVVRFRFSFSINRALSLLRTSFPFALVFLLMTLYTRMDGVMLERLIDDDGLSAGIYASGYRLLDAGNILGYLFAMLLLPMFSKLLGDKSDVNGLILSTTGLLMTLVTTISVISYNYASDFMKFIYTDVSHESITVFKVLMISFWFMSMSYIFGSLITASGQLRKFNMIFLVGIIVNWVMNLYLIPRQGALGAAIATVVTQAMVFIAQFFLAKSRFQLHFPATYLIKMLLFVSITFTVLHISKNFLELWWLVEVGLVGILLLALSILLGFFRLSWTDPN